LNWSSERTGLALDDPDIIALIGRLTEKRATNVTLAAPAPGFSAGHQNLTSR
jgi:hypothetical protein